MKTIELAELVAGAILHFCENLAELGCPMQEKNPDMWYRYLSPKKQVEVAQKLIDIIERDMNRFEEDKPKKKKKKK